VDSLQLVSAGGEVEELALVRKCTWALADIGTPEAKARLQDLAKSLNAQIAGYAQKRLDRWGRR
jgi:hypothetical protein